MTQQTIEAIKTKHQSLINRYIKWDRKHSDQVNEHDELYTKFEDESELDNHSDQVNQHDDLYLKYEDENKLYRAEERSMRQQENSFEKLQNLWDDLPKYEQKNVTKQYKSLFGYEPYSV